jgi:hypothetical protein
MANFGDILEDTLVREYAMGRLSAKSLCTLCFYAVQAGARGDGLRKLMLNPSSASGKFQKHLDEALPRHPPVDLCDVMTPSKHKGKRQDSYV